MLIQEDLSIQDKLKILTDAAKYDVACTSSGVKRRGKAGSIGNTSEAGICHSFAADGRCISLLKILFTNQCIYDCKYCVNRCSNDVVRTSFTPDEVCKLTIEFYRRNYIEGLFLSSGILYNATYTMELIYETLHKLRNQWRFNGYIHVKAIPGAAPELVEQIGFLADRMSVNLELPTAEGLKNLAPGKTRDKILSPMRQIQQGISVSSYLLGYDREYKKPYATERAGFAGGAALIKPELAQGLTGMPNLGNGRIPEYGTDREQEQGTGGVAEQGLDQKPQLDNRGGTSGHITGGAGYETPGTGSFKSRLVLPPSQYKTSSFVPAGQSTQMIVGATPENDYQMMAVTQALYQNYGLKRVFFSAYIPVNEDNCLPSLPGGPPLLREHRLYQADWLLRFYGFKAEELLSEDKPNFNVFLDPKCDWALRHLEIFPVEVNTASYEELLRVPGMGVKSAMRIVAARSRGRLAAEDLKKMGVVLKRARYFITCSGRMMDGARLDQDYITSCLIGDERRSVWDIENKDSYRQLSLFDDMHIEMPVTAEDQYAAVVGSL